MLHFSFSRYSGLSGACWPSPAGLSWSHWVASPRGLRHCPDQSGYFDSSCAVASGTGKASAASSATAAIERLFIWTSLVASQFRRRIKRYGRRWKALVEQDEFARPPRSRRGGSVGQVRLGEISFPAC